MSRAARFRILFWNPAISLMSRRLARIPGRGHSPLRGVWAELPLHLRGEGPAGGAVCQGCTSASAPSPSTLPVGTCFSQHTAAQKGSNLRQRKRVIARSTWVRWKLNSCLQAEGREETKLPKEGLPAPTLHFPLSLQRELPSAGRGRVGQVCSQGQVGSAQGPGTAGNQVQEGVGGASPISPPPLCCGTSGPRVRPGLGFPALTDSEGRRERGRDPRTPGNHVSHCLERL